MENKTVLADGESSLEECCPFLSIQKILSGKWSLLILCFLRGGKLRFGDLQRYIPDITQTTLTKTLRNLESDGLITRTVFPVVPPHVEYEFSDIGKEIIPVLESLSKFGVKYLKSRNPESKICSLMNEGSCRCCKAAYKV